MSTIIKSTDLYDITYYNNNAVYSVAWGAASGDMYSRGNLIIGQIKLDQFRVGRSYFWFDTSSLASDLVITSAKLYIYNRNAVSNYNNDFYIKVQRGIELDVNGIPVVHHTPITYGDYDKSLVGGDGGNILASTIPEVEGYFSIDLDEDGISWINKGAGAISKFCLRTDKDIDGVEPTEDVNKYLEIRGAAYDDPTCPYLEIFIAEAPDAPTNVQATDGEHTNKVVITWTKSEGATAYQVYRDSVALGWLGDVATYDDVGADAPIIAHGSITASDGSSTAHVVLSNTGASANDGTTHTYKVVAKNDIGESEDSNTDTGYRGVGALIYQWYRSAEDSDASYSSISGATASTYNDTAAPAPTITAGTASASDGSSFDYVSLSISGQSANVGEGRYYKCYHTATGAAPGYTGVNRGYRGVDSLTYQWQRSAADSDASYSNISSATTASYNDTGAPSNGSGRYYKCVEDATGADQQISTADRGYRKTVTTVITLTPNLVEDGIANLRLNLTKKGGLIINPVGWYCDENATPSTEYIETGWRAGGGGADLALGIYSKYVKTLPIGQTTLYVQAWCDDDGSNRYTGNIVSFDIPTEPEYLMFPDLIFPDFVLPEFVLPGLPDIPGIVYPELPKIPAIEIDLPDINYNIGMDLYLDRTYTRKDLEELRQKCINYEKNYTDFCLILNHNTLLIKNFLQSAYNNGVLGGENEMFAKIYPSQQLTPLYLEPLEPNDFKGIINRFINNNTSNSMGLNHNFDLFKEWLNDYNYTSDGYKASYITPREEIITNNEPTVKYLTGKINRLQREVSMASREITHNFNLMKEIIQ